MESLGDILKRLQQQSTSANTAYPEKPEGSAGQHEIEDPPCAICNGKGWLRRDVPIGHSDFGKAIPCDCQLHINDTERLIRLQRYSNMGRLATISFESTEPDGRSSTLEARSRFRTALQVAQNYANAPSGWLTLLGASFTGKTHLAAAIANSCIQQGTPALFATAPDLLEHLRSTYRSSNDSDHDDLLEQMRNVPLLILDDLGVQYDTPWAEEKLFQLLNHRYVTNLPTVITTNVPMDHMEPRLKSRLSDSRFSAVVDLGSSGRERAPSIGDIPPQLRKRMILENFEPAGKAVDKEGKESLGAALAMAKAFASDPQGWLVLVGDPGCGKTHLAVGIGEERLKLGQPVFFTLVPDLLDHLRRTFGPESRVTYDELFEDVKGTPLLILDDLGAESSTAWAHEKLYQIIVHRHNSQLPTIITTSRIPSGPKDAVASRLNDSRLVTVVPISAPDYRQQARRTRPTQTSKYSISPRGQR